MEQKNSKFNSQKGLTLIAFVVTLVVLIILATVSINVVIGERGIIQKAENAGQIHANSVVKEEEDLESLLGQLESALDDVVGEPKLDTTTATTMTPVKWNGSNWVKTTADDDEWYNYRNKQWANVVLGDATFNTDGTLDESKAYTQLVWIPRYAYKITSMYHASGTGAGNIDIVFIDTDNKDKNGKEYTRDSASEYPSATVGGGMADYVVHPAFDYGDKKLEGFWVGKYESSNTSCVYALLSSNVPLLLNVASPSTTFAHCLFL